MLNLQTSTGGGSGSPEIVVVPEWVLIFGPARHLSVLSRCLGLAGDPISRLSYIH